MSHYIVEGSSITWPEGYEGSEGAEGSTAKDCNSTDNLCAEISDRTTNTFRSGYAKWYCKSPKSTSTDTNK